MEDKSEVSYFCENNHILTIASIMPPSTGEVIYIDNEMDKEWYDSRFKTKKLFNQGVRSDFKVLDVRRYIKAYDITVTEKIEDRVYELPSQRLIETFEVDLEKIKK